MEAGRKLPKFGKIKLNQVGMNEKLRLGRIQNVHDPRVRNVMIIS